MGKYVVQSSSDKGNIKEKIREIQWHELLNTEGMCITKLFRVLQNVR